MNIDQSLLDLVRCAVIVSFKERFLAKVKEAKELVQDLEEPYRSIAFGVTLTHLLQKDEASGPIPTRVETAERSTLTPIIMKLRETTNRDLVLLILSEGMDLTKEQIIYRSSELGRPLSRQWMTKHFAEEMKGLVVVTASSEGKNVYKLSELGRVKADARLKELASK